MAKSSIWFLVLVVTFIGGMSFETLFYHDCRAQNVEEEDSITYERWSDKLTSCGWRTFLSGYKDDYFLSVSYDLGKVGRVKLESFRNKTIKQAMDNINEQIKNVNVGIVKP